MTPSDDIGASITELQNELATLQKQAQDERDDADKAAMDATVATGTFYSTYGRDGVMVWTFGANVR